MGWKISSGDHSMTDAEATAAHVAVVAELVGGDAWSSASPLSGPRVALAWLAVMVAAETKVPIVDAVKAVYAMPLAEFMESVTDLEV